MDKRGEGVFAKLISPVTQEDFFSKYWGKTYLYIPRGDPAYHRDILKFSDIDDYLGRNDLRYPYIRLVKSGRELPLNNYSSDSSFGDNLFQGNLDQDALFAEHANGATMCMQLQHQAIESLGRFTNQVESYLGFRTQSTIFLTPANSQGFTRHFDSHDFFTLPIEGEKTWRIYKEREQFPLPRKEVLDTEVDTSGEVEVEIQLCPGDTLYVPRGVYHDARSQGAASIQLSLGVFPYYWCDVLHALIDDFADKHAFLRSSAVQNATLNKEKIESDFRNILEQLKRDADVAEVISQLQEKSRSKQLKEGAHRLRDYFNLDKVNPDTRFVCRDIDARIQASDTTLLLSFYNKVIELPSYVGEQISVILAGALFCANSLPDSIDLAGRLFLIRKLLSEGLITHASS